MTLQDVVARFNTTPFLFAGAGITRRYYGLPDWPGLLKEFANRISSDRFAYNAYENAAKVSGYTQGLLPKVATLIQQDFDAKWYSCPEIRRLNDSELSLIERGVSPFKVEVASFLSLKSSVLPKYKTEIGKLKSISRNNLAGIITTNYDVFFEKLFEDYKPFVGQEELVFSSIQGIAEIYKIHGSVSHPASLIISEKDYEIFNNKSKYLAAKLMTIFMEYPIIFIGYSLTDTNIQNILDDIVACLPDDKFSTLQERFVFVEYNEKATGVSVSTHSIALSGKLLSMTKLTLEDFGLLYDALAAKKAALPVKLLRRFKEDIYTYIVTTKPGPLLQVAAIDNESIDEDRLAISIGLSSTGEYGLKRLIDDNRWYRNIVTDEFKTIDYSYDQLLELTYPEIRRQVNGYFPVCKYLANAKKSFPDIEATVPSTFDSIATTTNINSRNSISKYPSVEDLWKQEHSNPARMYRLLSCFPEEKMNVTQLGTVLQKVFDEDADALSHFTGGIRADVKRLIRMYDYLKWGKKIKDPCKSVPASRD
ncbi:MAG: SIR2 family protein [Clostridiales bacterium]|nr:SIR2 family protein [Clostridiales bacterium]MDY4171898.1 SIR2 family protein [Evtepia sp.]